MNANRLFVRDLLGVTTAIAAITTLAIVAVTAYIRSLR